MGLGFVSRCAPLGVRTSYCWHRAILGHSQDAGWAYAIPFAFLNVPMYIGEVTVWSVIIYWAVGLESSAGRFFCFWGTLVALQMQSSSLFRAIGATVRSTVTGTSVAVIVVLLNILCSGFVVLRCAPPRRRC